VVVSLTDRNLTNRLAATSDPNSEVEPMKSR
jgi:hypothetical protein